MLPENSVAVITQNGEFYVTSVNIADDFNKEHRNVLRAIENLECSEQFNQLNFKPNPYVDSKGRRQPMYLITRDGFSFLCMGFTGKEAAVWKEKYITAFNKMEKELLRQKEAKVLDTSSELYIKCFQQESRMGNMSLDNVQKNTLKEMIDQKAYSLGNIKFAGYMQRDMKKHFNLNTTNDRWYNVSQKDYEAAVRFITFWKPRNNFVKW